MRILLSILSILFGAGLVVYSYIAAFIRLAELSVADVDAGNPIGAIGRVLSFINSGEVPQVMNFLYLGAFLIAAGVVYMLFGGSRKTNDQ